MMTSGKKIISSKSVRQPTVTNFVKVILRFSIRLHRFFKRALLNAYHEIIRNRMFEAIYPGLRLGKGSRIIGPKIFGILFANLDKIDFPKLTILGSVNIGSNVLITISKLGSLEMHNQIYILDHCKIEVPSQGRVLIKQGSTIERFCTIAGTVTVEDNCILAPRVFVSTGVHYFDGPAGLTIRELDNIQKNNLSQAEIKLGPSAFLGVGSTILPGCVLGTRSVVGAGAVVTRSFTNGFEVIGGVPAKVLRKVSTIKKTQTKTVNKENFYT